MSELSGKWRNDDAEIEIIGPADAQYQVIGSDVYLARPTKGMMMPGTHLVTREALVSEGFAPVTEIDAWIADASQLSGGADGLLVSAAVALGKVIGIVGNYEADARYLPNSQYQKGRADAARYIKSVIEESLLGEK